MEVTTIFNAAKTAKVVVSRSQSPVPLVYDYYLMLFRLNTAYNTWYHDERFKQHISITSLRVAVKDAKSLVNS